MFIKKKTFPMIAPLVRSPPSRKAWKPTMFNEIGRSSREASATLFVHRQISDIRNTTDIIIMTYWLSIRTFINAYASILLYMSAVGSGNIPRVPNIGMISMALSKTFNIVFIIFMMC